MEHLITIRIPDSFDRLIPLTTDITDEVRREYIATILAVFVDNQRAPLIADALVRLNGGTVWPRVMRFQ